MSQEQTPGATVPQQEQPPVTPESPETSLQGKINTVESSAEDALNKINKLNEAGNLSPDAFKKLTKRIKQLQGAAAFALLMNASPALAENIPSEKIVEAPTISQAVETTNESDSLKRESTNQITIEGIQGKLTTLSNETINETLSSVTPIVVGVAQEAAKKQIEKLLETPMAIVNIPENINKIKDNVETLTSEGASGEEKIASALDAINTLNKYTAGKIPHVTLLTQLHQVYKDISEGKNIQDVSVGIARAALAAKTLGLGPVIFDYLKNLPQHTPSPSIQGPEQLP